MDVLGGDGDRAALLDVTRALLDLGRPLLLDLLGGGGLFVEARLELSGDERAILGGEDQELIEQLSRARVHALTLRHARAPRRRAWLVLMWIA